MLPITDELIISSFLQILLAISAIAGLVEHGCPEKPSVRCYCLCPDLGTGSAPGSLIGFGRHPFRLGVLPGTTSDGRLPLVAVQHRTEHSI